MEQEVAKYKKKKMSNTSKSKCKSNHKHQNVECLFREDKTKRLFLGTYCCICGKVYNIVLPTENSESFSRLLKEDEILNKYSNYDIHEINNIWQKYISLLQEEE